ncbi:MAG: hypothetical protein IJ571_02200 [Ruminococcus sp.]|nr:hypothetical protein [Ruminococcus sp.]
MIKNKWIKYIIFIAVLTGLWVLYEVMCAEFYRHSSYEFVLRRDILAPAAAAAAVGYFLFLKD